MKLISTKPAWLKMTCSKSISLARPLREVRLLTQAPARDWPEHLREREQSAYDRGLHDGAQARDEQSARREGEVIDQLDQLATALRQAVPQVIRESETTLIQLALESAQKLVAGLPVTVEMVEAVVRDALRQAEDTAEVTVQLHPDDLALLRNQASPLLQGLSETGPLKFAGSPEVTRGGCLVQTRFGQIDARRETKLEQLRQTLAI